MEPIIGQYATENQPLKVFSAIVPTQKVSHPNCAIGFVIRCLSTVESFAHQSRDSLFSQQLWSSAINRDRTDVEFKVGGKIFPAHRAIVMARCPALLNESLSDGDSASSSTTSRHVTNIAPDTFEKLLYFIYTGLIEEFPLDDDLVETAKYLKLKILHQVALATGRRLRLDQNQLSAVILSLA